GGSINTASGTLTIQPRLGSHKGSKQSKATDTITGNQANLGPGGAGGPAGGVVAGSGGSPNGSAGAAFPGATGVAGVSGAGVGGGLDLLPGGTAVIDDTAITGNTASTADSDVSGTFTT